MQTLPTAHDKLSGIFVMSAPLIELGAVSDTIKTVLVVPVSPASRVIFLQIILIVHSPFVCYCLHGIVTVPESVVFCKVPFPIACCKSVY